MGDSAGGNLANSVTVGLLNKYQKHQIDYKATLQVLVFPYLQMVDYQLPSHIINKDYFIGKNLAQKSWLAYCGLEKHYDLAEKLARNQHIKQTSDEIVREICDKFINPDLIDDKYKTNYTKPTDEPSTSCMEIPNELLERIIELMLDVRMSPLTMPDEDLALICSTHILVCGYDPLRDDGLLLHRRLQNLNVESSLQYLEKSTHGVTILGTMRGKGYHYEENMKMYKVIKRKLYPND